MKLAVFSQNAAVVVSTVNQSDERVSVIKPDDAVPHFSRELLANQEFLECAQAYMLDLLKKYNNWAEAYNQTGLINAQPRLSKEEKHFLYQALLITESKFPDGSRYNPKSGYIESVDGKVAILDSDVNFAARNIWMNPVELRNKEQETLCFCAREMAIKAAEHYRNEPTLHAHSELAKQTHQSFHYAVMFQNYQENMLKNIEQMNPGQQQAYLHDMPISKISNPGRLDNFLDAVGASMDEIRKITEKEEIFESGLLQGMMDYSVVEGTRLLQRNWIMHARSLPIESDERIEAEFIALRLGKIIQHFANRYDLEGRGYTPDMANPFMDATIPGLTAFRQVFSNLIIDGVVGEAFDKYGGQIKGGMDAVRNIKDIVLSGTVGHAYEELVQGLQNAATENPSNKLLEAVNNFTNKLRPVFGSHTHGARVITPAKAGEYAITTPAETVEMVVHSQYGESLRWMFRQITETMKKITPPDPAINARAGKLVMLDSGRDGLDGQPVQLEITGLEETIRAMREDSDRTLTIGTGSGYNEFSDSVAIVNALDRSGKTDGQIKNPDKHAAIFMHNAYSSVYESLLSIHEKPYGKTAQMLAAKIDAALSFTDHKGRKCYHADTPEILSRIRLTGGSLGAETSVQVMEILRENISNAYVYVNESTTVPANNITIKSGGTEYRFPQFAVMNTETVGVSGVSTPSDGICHINIRAKGDLIAGFMGKAECSMAFSDAIMAYIQKMEKEPEKRKFEGFRVKLADIMEIPADFTAPCGTAWIMAGDAIDHQYDTSTGGYQISDDIKAKVFSEVVTYMTNNGANSSYGHGFSAHIATFDVKGGYYGRNRDRKYPCISFDKKNGEIFMNLRFADVPDVMLKQHHECRKRIDDFGKSENWQISNPDMEIARAAMAETSSRTLITAL